jgi:hypothetical protein
MAGKDSVGGAGKPDKPPKTPKGTITDIMPRMTRSLHRGQRKSMLTIWETFPTTRILI